MAAVRGLPTSSSASKNNPGLQRNRPRTVLCNARQDPQHSTVERAASRLSGLASAVVVAGSLLAAPVGLQPADARTRLSSDEQKVVDLFNKSTSSVVNVTNLSSRRDAFTSDLQDYPAGAGSGIVWDKQGHVVTNYHVIKGASTVQIVVDGGAEFPAKVLGQDEDRDVAVLQVEEKAEALRPVSLGTSADVSVGQKVYAIGNPFGLDHTLTTGIVSGVKREIQSGITGRPIQDAIQTDAAINPGNSGGPLLDSAGDLIGINTAIYSPSGANSGVGFAIPVDTVKDSVTEIIANGRVVRPVLGIAFAPDSSTSQLGVNGILVLSVKDGGPASKAGVKGTSRDSYGRLVLGDIIIGADGKKIKTAADLYRALDKCKVGQNVDLELLRQDSKEHVQVTLEPNQPSTMTVVLKSGDSKSGDGKSSDSK